MSQSQPSVLFRDIKISLYPLACKGLRGGMRAGGERRRSLLPRHELRCHRAGAVLDPADGLQIEHARKAPEQGWAVPGDPRMDDELVFVDQPHLSQRARKPDATD